VGAIIKPEGNRPTNKDLMVYIAQLHHCLDEHKKTTKVQFEKHERTMGELKHSVHGVEHELLEMSTALGTRTESPKSTIATMSPHRAVFTIAATTGSTLAGLFVLIKIGAALTPTFIAGLLAVWKVVVG
jgi:hypothetical protein